LINPALEKIRSIENQEIKSQIDIIDFILKHQIKDMLGKFREELDKLGSTNEVINTLAKTIEFFDRFCSENKSEYSGHKTYIQHINSLKISYKNEFIESAGERIKSINSASNKETNPAVSNPRTVSRKNASTPGGINEQNKSPSTRSSLINTLTQTIYGENSKSRNRPGTVSLDPVSSPSANQTFSSMISFQGTNGT
jgi:hypothetical protein